MNDGSNGNHVSFKFNGNGWEYFKIWIVNIVLTILTLGIYSAWATVRKRRYFYGNTEFNNTSFEYMATPWMILKGRLVAVSMVIIFSLVSQFFPPIGMIFAIILFAAVPWIVWNSFRFRARMSAYRNVRFGFKGKLGSIFIYIFLLPILPLLITGLIAAILSFSQIIDQETTILLLGIGMVGTYLIFPLIQAKFSNYYVNGTAFGQGGFDADISAGTFYTTYLIAFLIIIGLSITIGILVFLIFGSNSLESFQSSGSQPENIGSPGGVIIAAYLLFILFGLWLRAYISTNIRNYIYGSTCLDSKVQLQSFMTTNGLFSLYLVNTVLLIFTLGLAYPWAAIRVARFRADNTSAMVQGDLSGYVTEQHAYQSSLGDELGDALDLDMDITL